MRTAIPAVQCLLLSVVAGCGQADPAPSVAPRVGAGRPAVAPQARVVWTPSLVEDGGMFRDEASFRRYVGESEVAVVGTLTSWDARSGTLRVERVIHGRAGAEIPLVGSGGFIRPIPGERVIALLSTRRGKLTLHSFCAASGLYAYTQRLADYLDGSSRARPS